MRRNMRMGCRRFSSLWFVVCGLWFLSSIKLFKIVKFSISRLKFDFKNHKPQTTNHKLFQRFSRKRQRQQITGTFEDEHLTFHSTEYQSDRMFQSFFIFMKVLAANTAGT